MTSLLRNTVLFLLLPLSAAFVARAPSTTRPITVRLNSNKKDSDRAHFEKNFEDAMNNDWRLFRAKLIAHEQQAQDEQQRSEGPRPYFDAPKGQTPYYAPPKGPTPPRYGAPEGRRLYFGSQGQKPLERSKLVKVHNDDYVTRNGPMFEGSSITHQSSREEQRQYFQQMEQEQQQRQVQYVKPQQQTTFQADPYISSLLKEIGHLGALQDPFVSPAELPLMIQPRASVDRHRWAHAIPDIEPGCVLIANEKLGGEYHQTVILLVEHCQQRGTIGIVLNRYVNLFCVCVFHDDGCNVWSNNSPDRSLSLTSTTRDRVLDGDLEKITSKHESNLAASQKRAFKSAPVTVGGPVMSSDFNIIHGFGEVEGSSRLCPGLFVGGYDELMSQVDNGRFDPRNSLFFKGHTAWEQGELANEISRGVWYMAAASSNFILNAGTNHDLWSDILMSMGGRYADTARTYGHDNNPLLP